MAYMDIENESKEVNARLMYNDIVLVGLGSL